MWKNPINWIRSKLGNALLGVVWVVAFVLVLCVLLVITQRDPSPRMDPTPVPSPTPVTYTENL